MTEEYPKRVQEYRCQILKGEESVQEEVREQNFLINEVECPYPAADIQLFCMIFRAFYIYHRFLSFNLAIRSEFPYLCIIEILRLCYLECSG